MLFPNSQIVRWLIASVSKSPGRIHDRTRLSQPEDGSIMSSSPDTHWNDALSGLRSGFRTLIAQVGDSGRCKRPPPKMKRESLHLSALWRPVPFVDRLIQRLPVPRSSEYPALTRDHWAVGRPSVRKFCLPAKLWGQPAGESSHFSCRPYTVKSSKS